MSTLRRDLGNALPPRDFYFGRLEVEVKFMNREPTICTRKIILVRIWSCSPLTMSGIQSHPARKSDKLVEPHEISFRDKFPLWLALFLFPMGESWGKSHFFGVFCFNNLSFQSVSLEYLYFFQPCDIQKRYIFIVTQARVKGHPGNPSTWEAKAGRLLAQGQPELHTESQRAKHKDNKNITVCRCHKFMQGSSKGSTGHTIRTNKPLR